MIIELKIVHNMMSAKYAVCAIVLIQLVSWISAQSSGTTADSSRQANLQSFFMLITRGPFGFSNLRSKFFVRKTLLVETLFFVI